MGFTAAAAMNCTHCSAKIPADALTCPYCGSDTPHAAQARAQKEQQARHAAQLAAVDAGKARQKGVLELEKSARTAFYASILGVVVCCLPVGSLVGIVMGLKARKTAAALGAPAPWQSMAAIVLGVFWLGFVALALVMGVVGEREKAARIATLRDGIKETVRKSELDTPTACALAEIALLEGGVGQGQGSLSLDRFRCDGAVEVSGATAVLKDVEFARQVSKPTKTVDACFTFRSKWRVDWIGNGPKCGQGADAGSAADED